MSDNPTTEQVKKALRVTAGYAHAHQLQSWAVLGEMACAGAEDDENARVLAHDGVGRLLVRLDITQLWCVGAGRAVAGLHHGAVMEGSWGSESVPLPDAESAVAELRTHLSGPVTTWPEVAEFACVGLVTPQQVIVVAGGHDIGLADKCAAMVDNLPATPKTIGSNP